MISTHEHESVYPIEESGDWHDYRPGETAGKVGATEEPFNPDIPPEIDPAPPQPGQPTPPPSHPTPSPQPIQPTDPVQPGNPSKPIQPSANI